jgi:hypothetical protein
VNQAHNELLRAWRHKRRDWGVTRMTARALGEDTPSEPESSEEKEEEEEEGEELHHLSLHYERLFPCLVVSSTGKWGSQSMHANQNVPNRD